MKKKPSDTPRTDEVEDCMDDDNFYVRVEFARTLERELRAAKQKVFDMEKVLDEMNKAKP